MAVTPWRQWNTKNGDLDEEAAVVNNERCQELASLGRILEEDLVFRRDLLTGAEDLVPEL